MNPIITFIIPSINRPTLARALNSLIAQSNSNWKAIVVLDGVETDLEFDADSRITFMNVNKTGQVGPWTGMAGLVRNHGISAADTKWIGFLDDDDTLDKDYVSDLVSIIESDSEIGLVLFTMQYTKDKKIVPDLNRPLEFGNVGISFCYKQNVEKILFDRNLNGEDLEMFNKIKNQTKYLVSKNIRYYVR